MPNPYPSGDKFCDISAIDARLTELEQEKQQLLALREELQKSKPTPPVSDSFSAEQKITIFRSLYRGRTDIFANRWQNQEGRSGHSVGEGFDLPRLDTLFLAMPIAWKGSLAQYAGRIHRESDGKTQVTIHDYVDCGLPMLQRMFNKREKSYKAMGYTILFSRESASTDKANQFEAVLV